MVAAALLLHALGERLIGDIRGADEAALSEQAVMMRQLGVPSDAVDVVRASAARAGRRPWPAPSSPAARQRCTITGRVGGRRRRRARHRPVGSGADRLCGAGLPHDSIQVGLSRAIIQRFVEEWTVSITDLTPLVQKLRKHLDEGRARSGHPPAAEGGRLPGAGGGRPPAGDVTEVVRS